MSEEVAATQRAQATQEVVNQGLTLAQTQQLVNQIIEKHTPFPVNERNNKQATTIGRGSTFEMPFPTFFPGSLILSVTAITYNP